MTGFERKALYAGSFDPLTNGHMSVLRAGLALFDHISIAVGVHAKKQGLFSYDERKKLIMKALADSELDHDRVTVISFDGLVVDAARDTASIAMLRGLRDSTDYAYEMQMAGMNTTLAPDVETVFVPAESHTRPIAATLVRQIAAMGGDISEFVPPVIAAAMTAKLSS